MDISKNAFFVLPSFMGNWDSVFSASDFESVKNRRIGGFLTLYVALLIILYYYIFTSKKNNKMERLNGEIRQREKTMRGLERKVTQILKGYQIFHNYIREHEGLDGKTPAEACGISIEGKNKWKTLIQNASL